MASAETAVLSDLFLRLQDAPGPEEAIHMIGRAAHALLGDPAAKARPGAYKPGEAERDVLAIFMVMEGAREMMLVGEAGFLPEQHRLVIDIMEGKPGWVVRNKQSLVLPNTDDDAGFTQIISVARMGSSMYAPILWKGEALGVISIARMARRTFLPEHLPMLEGLAALAGMAWTIHGGAAFLARQTPGVRMAVDRPDR